MCKMRFGFIATVHILAWLFVVANGVNAEQNQGQMIDPVKKCLQLPEFENATEPWPGYPDDASLDNMCLVRCVLEELNLIVDRKIDCKASARVLDIDIKAMRKYKLDINETSWRKGSEMCCLDATEGEFSVEASNNSTRVPNDYEDLCMRAHFLWHCEFQAMCQSIPQEQLESLKKGTWRIGAIDKRRVGQK
ncbi:hypothetical protein R5R35_011247 [Gryllus longicercus]|uniref:Odorant binding protein n=1 Tax=Gryllus longicercus TaxID=2509291 RepID=A0AAN9VZ54_9ORTH